ncbi:MAG: efflux RND transporter permease subunit [Desulfobacteraceae bacterium]|nr:efflux RND transporter permease subunit [Desulfobacteraceae bacterium]
MWIVRLALRRPYTVAVMVLLIICMGLLSLSRMIVDIFPAIDIPVVIVVWNYPGLSPEDMERRIVLISERAYSTTVNGIQRIESQSIPGIGVIKVFFHPGTEIAAAIAQISAVSNTLLRIAPPGTQSPVLLQFNASNVPVAQLTLSSESLPEEQIFDFGLNFIRVRLFTIPGLSSPAPFGGKNRQVMIDVDPEALAARGLSPQDVVNALQASNIILPAGTARIGNIEYNVLTNSSPLSIDEFKTIPIRVLNGAPVYIGDVAQVSDSFAVQNNIVHVNGKRAAYLALLKHSDASTLAVVEAARDILPSIKEIAPEGLDLKIDFDQSVFVRAAVEGVVQEAILGAVLVSLMILLFLGSWRSMFIVIISIPLAILTSIIGLNLVGYSINIMTLGGLALAIGMLVDDATVEVENIHRNLGMGKPMTVAILDGARQVAVPAIVATLSICIVFFPVVLLYGAARFLFTPLALAVVIAMLASYVLSRTLVPTMARMLMPGERHGIEGGTADESELNWPARTLRRANRFRDRHFESFRQSYTSALKTVMEHPRFSLVTIGLLGAMTLWMVPQVGTDFFPSVDAGLMKLHFRAPPGTRIEETEKLVAEVENAIREIIAPNELETINDMIGVPIYYNLAFVQTENIGGMDTDILIALKSGHQPTAWYKERIRKDLAERFPGSTFYFQAADIVTQVLNFGITSPLSIQVEALNLEAAYGFARGLAEVVRTIPGAADVHINEVLDYPTIQVDVDRYRAASLGLTQRDISSSLLTSLSSSTLVAPSYFLNPKNNVNYSVVVQTPINRIRSVDSIDYMPVSSSSVGSLLPSAPTDSIPVPPSAVPKFTAPTLSDFSAIRHRVSPENINHYTVQRVVNLDLGVEGRDLGGVTSDIRKKIGELGELPAGMRIHIRGQNEVMEQSFRSLGLGLILAIILVYFLMVTLFQSWIDPFIIMIAVPGALVGITWMLLLTGTTINVESLMGSIMAVGIGTSNSILLVSFANDRRVEADITPFEAVEFAASTRLRPVLMTALAMVIGMLPMALGLGEAGEQNAPLGRAVIGGLVIATLATLFVVPVIYVLLRKKMPTKYMLEKRFQAEERGEEVGS